VTTRLGGEPGAAGAAAFRNAAQEWALARADLRLEGRRNIYWTADGWADSVIPKDEDPGLLDRRDTLAAALDARLLPAALAGPGGAEEAMGAAGLCRAYAAPDILADCARDAIALAAALKAPRTVVLTSMEAGEDRPRLVHWLDQAGVCCRPLEEGPVREVLRWQFAPALLRSGLAVPIGRGAAAPCGPAPGRAARGRGGARRQPGLGRRVGDGSAGVLGRRERDLVGGTMNGLQANRPIGPRGRHGGGCGCGRCATAVPRMIERLALESLSAALAHAQQGRFEADLGMEAATPAGPLTLPGEFSGWRPPTPVMEVLFGSPPAEFTHRPKEKDPRDRRFLYRLYRRGGEKALYIGMAYNTRVQDRVWSHLKGLVTQSQRMAKTPTVMNLRNMSLQAIKDSKSEIGSSGRWCRRWTSRISWSRSARSACSRGPGTIRS
jgi:hypothetical protein